MKIKLFLFIIGVFCIHTLKAQSKLIFSYDASGNQNQRYYCTSTNCTPPPPPPIAPLEEETTQLKPTEEIFFSISIVPLSTLNTPSVR